MGKNQSQNNPLAINVPEICEKLQVPEDVYLRIIKKSYTTTEQDIKDLSQAITTGDFDTIKRIAHRLKGTYSNLRIDALSAGAKEMDEIALTHSRVEKIAELLQLFQRNFDDLKKTIR